ncbi:MULTISPECIES: 5-oxoprolinase subunit PxpA [unclassified Pseudomonas]|uniref:5-oxoprolinase subunit PxpA n=1 Tax=unclassified Pseudomonas TaxID=196821 RepID=UPI0033946DA1
MQVVDFNSDMGEGFGPWTIGDGVDNELMGYISTANIATGFHAGDPGTMRRTVERAKALGVAVGAHPGFRDLVGFGRRHINAPAQELVDDMLYQLGALREIARAQGVRLQHIKPHGALYMHLARDEEAARLLVENLRVIEPELLLYCMPGSVICRIAQELGQPVIREFYADREYDLSGSIVFTRNVRGHEPGAVAERVLRACQQGVVRTVEGQDLAIEFDSICLHSDTPGALELVEATRQALDAAGIVVRAPR